jgi:serine/threonine protein kinase
MSKMHLEKIGVCVEIASGLAYLHEQGVIFRDLKPNNIGFLNGRVQLFDFGLSRELPSLNLQEPFEMSGKVGTLRYMAVEVACHQVYNVSADVYSWAMVCYEIFTHEKPFAGWTREMHASLVCGRGMRPEVQSLPNSIRPLLEACWSQHAHHRPTMQVAEQSMKQLEEKEILSVNQDRQPVVELPHGFSVGVRKNTNRNYSEAEFTRSTVSVSVSSESLSNSVYLY